MPPTRSELAHLCLNRGQIRLPHFQGFAKGQCSTVRPWKSVVQVTEFDLRNSQAFAGFFVGAFKFQGYVLGFADPERQRGQLASHGQDMLPSFDAVACLKRHASASHGVDRRGRRGGRLRADALGKACVEIRGTRRHRINDDRADLLLEHGMALRDECVTSPGRSLFAGLTISTTATSLRDSLSS